jgi:hypothetical protein
MGKDIALGSRQMDRRVIRPLQCLPQSLFPLIVKMAVFPAKPVVMVLARGNDFRWKIGKKRVLARKQRQRGVSPKSLSCRVLPLFSWVCRNLWRRMGDSNPR